MTVNPYESPSEVTGPPAIARTVALVDPHLFGTFCGLFSAFVYTCSNSFLRAVDTCDPVWVSAIKAVPTVVIMGTVIAVLAWRGQKVLPPLPMLAAIAVGGLMGPIGGNISFQWAAGQAMVHTQVPMWRVVAGVTAACWSGFAYSILNVILRYCITRGAPLPATLFTVSIVGLVALGLLAWLRI